MRLSDRFSIETPIVVAGAGGFIGGHLVAELERQGFTDICAVDVKPTADWFQTIPGIRNETKDLSLKATCLDTVPENAIVFNLAADMGGMGYIENNKLNCMLSVLINTHLLEAAASKNSLRYFYASSACVYRADLQLTASVTALKEDDAYPADPEDGYGWEKLFSERMCLHFKDEGYLKTRIARFHNVYGPLGTYFGGREKAPAAICRKVAEAKLSGIHEIEIWGDGEQTRSFMYVSDAILGITRLVASEFAAPLNVGSDRLVSINGLVDIVEDVAGIRCKRRYLPTAPLGVRGRNSDNTLIREVLGWAPSNDLESGLEATYRWIYDELLRS